MRIAWQPADNVILRPVGDNHFLHPDDFDYYLPPYTIEAFSKRLASLGIRQVEHPKVTQVHGLRAMSTWVGMNV